MKVGDLVSLKMKKTQPSQVPRIGVIVETWTAGHTGVLTTIDVMWGDDQGSKICGYSPSLFEVVNQS